MSHSKRTVYRWFTLKELMVNVAMIGMLLALFSPAVRVAREAAGASAPPRSPNGVFLEHCRRPLRRYGESQRNGPSSRSRGALRDPHRHQVKYLR